MRRLSASSHAVFRVRSRCVCHAVLWYEQSQTNQVEEPPFFGFHPGAHIYRSVYLSPAPSSPPPPPPPAPHPHHHTSTTTITRPPPHMLPPPLHPPLMDALNSAADEEPLGGAGSTANPCTVRGMWRRLVVTTECGIARRNIDDDVWQRRRRDVRVFDPRSTGPPFPRCDTPRHAPRLIRIAT